MFLDLFGKDELETAFLDSTAELYRELFDAATPFVQAKIGLLKNADPVNFCFSQLSYS